MEEKRLRHVVEKIKMSFRTAPSTGVQGLIPEQARLLLMVGRKAWIADVAVVSHDNLIGAFAEKAQKYESLRLKVSMNGKLRSRPCHRDLQGVHPEGERGEDGPVRESPLANCPPESPRRGRPDRAHIHDGKLLTLAD